MNEIERKFLIKQLPENIKLSDPKHIQQGYIAVDPDGTEVRLRNMSGKCFLTVKSSGNLTRTESENEISSDMFHNLWCFTEGKRIEKKRFSVPLENDLVCEIDIYSGVLKGLITAEIEFSSVEEAANFTPLTIFHKDVTSDPAYKNKNLAVKGMPNG